MTPSLKMSKFVLSNWTLLIHILKSVRKWPMTDHYYELCMNEVSLHTACVSKQITSNIIMVAECSTSIPNKYIPENSKLLKMLHIYACMCTYVPFLLQLKELLLQVDIQPT